MQVRGRAVSGRRLRIAMDAVVAADGTAAAFDVRAVDGRDDRRRLWRAGVFVVVVLVLGATGFLIVKAFLAAHLIGAPPGPSP